MGLFDSLVQKIVKPAVQKQVQKVASVAPAQLLDVAKQALPTSVPAGLSGMFQDDPNSGFLDTTAMPWLRDTFSSKPEFGRLSESEIAGLDATERARMENQDKGFFSKVGDFFTDDPNSGWYDEMQNTKALQQYNGNSPADLRRADDLAIQNQNEQRLADMRSGEASYQFPQKSSPSTNWSDKLSGILTGGSGAGLAVGANLLGGLGGYLGSKSDYEAAENTQRQAADLAGAYEALGASQAASVADNENMVALRAKALQGLQQRADMGLTPEDQAALNKLRNQTNAQFQSRQATIQEDMGRRGLGNSGLNLAAQLSNNQAQTQNQSNLADTQAAMSFNAKQSALQNLGNASSTALQQDFDRDISRATNADAVSRFNATNKMNSSQNKANAVQNIAQTQAQAAARKSQMISDAGKTIGSGVTAYNQSQVKKPVVNQ